jgi:hypothetical protein
MAGMGWYNGFSPEQRWSALAWLKRQGLANPTKCDACGQTEGLLQRHSEDYSSPFGPHIGAISFCHRCHMLVHFRFRSPDAWKDYRLAIADGWCFAPLYRMGPGAALHWSLNNAIRTAPPKVLLLDRIESAGATSPKTPRQFDLSDGVIASRPEPTLWSRRSS